MEFVSLSSYPTVVPFKQYIPGCKNGLTWPQGNILNLAGPTFVPGRKVGGGQAAEGKHHRENTLEGHGAGTKECYG